MRKISVLLFVCISSLIIAGCATTGQDNVSVVVDDNGRIEVKGKYVSLAELGRAVKKSGAKTGSVIEVRIPGSASPKLRQALARSLATSGYSRTFFIKQRQSAAYIDKKTATPQKRGRSGTF